METQGNTKTAGPAPTLEVLDSEGTSLVVHIDELPFRVGRGVDASNQLKLDDRRISRRCLSIAQSDRRYFLEDLGQRSGIFINGTLVEGEQNLYSGDVISFGQVEGLHIIFRAGPGQDVLPNLLSRLEKSETEGEGVDRNLRHISLLLEATALLQSALPLEDVLAAMVDRAIVVTDADRGLLLRTNSEGELQPLVARQKDGERVGLDSISPSQTFITQAIKQKHSLVELDISGAQEALREAKSIVAQKLKSVAAIPLYSHSHLKMQTTTSLSGTGELLGVLYLDSQSPAAFSGLGRQILDALAVEATSVIENARLLERERERRRLEQELSIAREIQQALLPKGFQTFPHCQITAANNSCFAVGGDYFDLMELPNKEMGFVLADVSGKGLPAALLTSMLQGCFSGMAFSQEPTKLVSHINEFVCARTDPNRYATLFFGVLHPSGKLDYINAGHDSPLLVRNGKVTAPFPSGCVPMGLLPATEFSACTATLEPGDTMVLFTDGVTEAVNIKGVEFDLSRLRELLEANAGAPIRTLQEKIFSSVHDFARNAQQADDITVMVLRYQKTA